MVYKLLQARSTTDSASGYEPENVGSIPAVPAKISLVCRGLRKSAYGYTWEYV